MWRHSKSQLSISFGNQFCYTVVWWQTKIIFVFCVNIFFSSLVLYEWCLPSDHVEKSFLMHPSGCVASLNGTRANRSFERIETLPQLKTIGWRYNKDRKKSNLEPAVLMNLLIIAIVVCWRVSFLLKSELIMI